MKKDIQILLNKELDRKDFLKHIGFGLVALTGVATMARSLGTFGTKQQTQGFGAGAYGGPKVATATKKS